MGLPTLSELKELINKAPILPVQSPETPTVECAF